MVADYGASGMSSYGSSEAVRASQRRSQSRSVSYRGRSSPSMADAVPSDSHIGTRLRPIVWIEQRSSPQPSQSAAAALP
jgi:hypothetical protein